MKSYQLNEHKIKIAKPKPRDAKILNCFAISLYGSLFFLFLLPWMDTRCEFYVLKKYSLIAMCLIIHFIILYYRKTIYYYFCKLSKRRIRFFEVPYFSLVSIFYGIIYLVSPFLLGLISFDGSVSTIFQNDNLTKYVLFSGGIALVIGAISGFDIYPVNTFGTKGSIEFLIGITRDLMKLSNRILVVITGSIIVGWVFKKVEFSLPVIYLTIYGVVGFALGSTGALGSRVNGMLYELSEIEMIENNNRNVHKSEIESNIAQPVSPGDSQGRAV